MPSYTRPFLYPKQRRAIFTTKRWALCEASTKSGKTVASIARFLEWGFAGKPGENYWWVAPVSDQARIAFSRVKQGLTAGSFTSRESPTPSIKLITGPTLSFKSADNADSLFGEDVYGAIIDEASRCAPEAWYAVRSTLTATRGPCVMIGNVKGRKNWFYEFCRRVESGEEPNGNFSRITWRDAVEAGVLDIEEIEDARRNLPELVFQELYEAIASDDGGNPFGLQHIADCVRGLSNLPPVAFGIDLAKKQDYLVVLGLDENGYVCSFSRWNGIPWRESIRRIHSLVGEDIPALVDSTGIGDPVLEELQVGHGNFIGYHFSPASKQRLMEGLAVGIQSHETSVLEGVHRKELESFEYELTRTGVRYTAPEGYHDDCVCAHALAREQWTTTAPGANVTKYMAGEASRINIRDASRDLDREQVLELMPWRAGAAIDLDNELTDLYESTLRGLDSSRGNNLCAGCGNPLSGATRISDGVFTWHPSCSGFGAPNI